MSATKGEAGNRVAKILLERGADFSLENAQGWVFFLFFYFFIFILFYFILLYFISFCL